MVKSHYVIYVRGGKLSFSVIQSKRNNAKVVEGFKKDVGFK